MRAPPIVAAFAAGLVLAACGTSPKRQQSNQFASAFRFVEQPERDEDVPFDHTAHLAVVDYKSRIQIEPDRTALAAIAAELEAGAPPPERSAGDQATFDHVARLMGVARDYVDKVGALNAAFARLPASPSPAEIEAYQALSKEQATLGLAVVNTVLEIAEGKARQEYGDGPDAADKRDEFAGELVAPLFEDDGEPVALNLIELEKFLRRELDALIAIHNREVERAQQARSANLRIRADLLLDDGNKVPLHVENYDTLEKPRGLQSSRITMLSEAERTRVKEGYQLATEAAQLYRDLRDRNSEVRGRLRGLRKEVKDAIEDVKALDFGFVDDAVVAAAKAAVDVVLTRIGDQLEEARQKQLRDLKDFLGQLADIRAKAETLAGQVAALRGTASLENEGALLELFVGLRDQIATLQDAGGALVEMIPAVQALPERLDALTDGLARAVAASTEAAVEAALAAALASIPEEQRVKMSALVTERIPAIRSGFENVLAGLKRYEKLWQVVARQRGDSGASGRAPTGEIDLRIKKVPVDQVSVGHFDLAGTPAERDHQVAITMELLRQGAEGSETLLRETSKTLDVQKLGVSSKTSAHLTFVKAGGSSDPTRRDVDFDPFPSISWTLHYLPRVEKDTGFFKRAWATVDPGLGLNVAALKFDDENVQIGVGVHVSLFDELLVFGYGYNLNADDDADYLYLGIGLLELLDQTGLR